MKITNGGGVVDHYITVWTVVVFVENRLSSGFDYAELEKATGFSLPHLRARFAAYTGKSLSRYVLSRRIANTAFEITHGEQNILDIATKYGFSNPDSFTRAFRRITGVNPNDFRKQRRFVGHVKLCAGVYGVSVNPVTSGVNQDTAERKDDMNAVNEQKRVSDGSVVLYSVPKVHYGAFGGITPYPICLKAVANYMGFNLDYVDAIVQCGAAFRLVWDNTAWNGGNVDVLLAFDEPVTVFKSGVEALGREFMILGRDGTAKTAEPEKFGMAEDSKTKADFIAFIKESIDNGVPVIALGIIGPPEACVITGYRDNGQTLLGWNCFQDSPEFASSIAFDESGYFVTSSWWENKDTVAVMTIGKKTGEPQQLKTIVERAVAALSGRQHEKYAKGINAYDAWKTSLLDESQFKRDMVSSLLVERLMCQGDAMDCLADGRKSAYKYFKKLADENPKQPLLGLIAEQFAAVATCVHKMYETLGGWERGEKQMHTLAKREVRVEIGRLIDSCKAADEKALGLMRELMNLL